jgi:hypothetical protein
MSAKSLSPKLYSVLEKRINERKLYKTDKESGQTLPFIFKLEGTGVIDRTAEPHREIRRDAFLLPKTEGFDPYDTKKPVKVLKNITAVETKWDEEKGKEVEVEQLEPIFFNSGYCYVNVEEIDKLAYLMFGDGNTTKPKSLTRPGAKPLVRWEEDGSTLYTGKKSDAISDIKMLGLALEVAKRADLNRMKNVLAKVSADDKFAALNPLGKDALVIENDFFVFVRNNPKAFLHTDVDQKTKIEVLIAESKYKGFLKHDADSAKWVLKTNKNDIPFYQYNKVTDKNPEQSLLDHLLDSKNSAKLTKLEYHNRPFTHPYLPAEDSLEQVEEEEAVA